MYAYYDTRSGEWWSNEFGWIGSVTGGVTLFTEDETIKFGGRKPLGMGEVIAVRVLEDEDEFAIIS